MALLSYVNNRGAGYLKSVLYSSTFMMCLAVSPANAQSTSNQPASATTNDIGDIVVTARKIAESAQKIPVVLSVVPAEKLENLQIRQMNDLPSVAPGLTIGNFQAIGAQVALRGVGATAFSNNIDQSVSLNIDGVQIGSGHGYKLGLFDLGQVEVLKGPQSLFYGKSTTGGVISLKTADPTDTPELILKGGYEIESRAYSGEAILSGPIGDTLKARAAIHYEKSQGYFRNATTSVLAGTGALLPSTDRAGGSRNVMMRGTVIWEPSSNFSARLKASYADTLTLWNLVAQYTNCSNGTGVVPPRNLPFIGGQNSCKLGRNTYVVAYDPAAFPGVTNIGYTIPHNGQPFSHTKIGVGSLNLSYQPVENISLDSTTGYYWVDNEDWVNAYSTTYAGAPVIADAMLKRKGFTQELRASSSFEGPLNFMVGGFFEDNSLDAPGFIPANVLYGLPAMLQWRTNGIDTKTYSGFGQLKFKVIPEFELAAGVRYADEKRSQNNFDFITKLPIAVPVSSIRSKKWMPDFTATYLPNDNLTVFAAYRKGFKSGAFGTIIAGLDNSFGDESAKGFEGGIKSRLFDRQLVLNIAGYRYKFSGLQVGIQGPPTNGVVLTRIVNATSSKTYGVDLDFAFRPQAAQGLQLTGAVNWNRARFGTLNNVPCWVGQTIAQGCNQNFNTTSNLFTAQDLSGSQLPRAPEWQFTLGGSYEVETGGDYSVVFDSSMTYSGRYPNQLATGIPNGAGFQGSYAKFDLGVTLKSPNDRWEAAVTVKNIADKVIASSCTMLATQAGGVFGGVVTGAATSGPGGQGQTICFPQAGRAIWLRLQWNLFGK